MNLSTSCILSAAKLVQAITSSPWFSAIVTLTHLLIPCLASFKSILHKVLSQTVISLLLFLRPLTLPTQWTWVWVDSRIWWWTGRPGMLQFMGSQRVGHDWVTELNWTEWLTIVKLSNWLHLSLLLSFVPSLAIHVLLCFPYTLNSFQRP